MNQIMRLRRHATADYDIKDDNNGYGHEKAFTDLVEKYGTLHEAQLLPRSYGQGSLVRSQTDPRALKQLVESLPTVINGLKSGKVSPRKALVHGKLPNQDQVRRIYHEIETKDERLELNMYIVGEGEGEGEPHDEETADEATEDRTGEADVEPEPDEEEDR
jgi:succinate dehydrogenase / fumarate reductase, iron-sulfur subunit